MNVNNISNICAHKYLRTLTVQHGNWCKQQEAFNFLGVNPCRFFVTATMHDHEPQIYLLYFATGSE